MSECDNNFGGCRLTVSVEENFSPCSLMPKLFDVEIHSKNGRTVASGKVAGGGSAVFELPEEGEYAVTVTGGIFSSPRAQTRRVSCCCGSPNGVTFVFMSIEQDCAPRPPKPPCHMPPCCCDRPEPPKPPKPPHHHCPCEDEEYRPPKQPCCCDRPEPPKPPKPPHHHCPCEDYDPRGMTVTD